MRLLWDNLADNATLAANSANNNYPLANVLDWQAAKAYRANSTTAEWIVLDAGANNTFTATGLGIVEHNWGANGNYFIQANNANNWSAPALNQAITRVAGVITQAFNSTTQRYWRLYFNDTANPDGYLKVGYFTFGIPYQFTDPPQKDFPLAYDDTTSRWQSKTGQEFVNQGVVARRYSFQWPYFTNADRLLIEAIYDTVGMARPMVVIPDENQTANIAPLFMRLAESPAWNHLIALKWNLTLSFKEQK